MKKVTFSTLLYLLLSTCFANQVYAQVIDLKLSDNSAVNSIKEVAKLEDPSGYLLYKCIDSILTIDNNNLEAIIQFAFPIRFDSIYASAPYILVEELKNSTDKTDQSKIAQALIDLRYDALLVLSRDNENRNNYLFWRHLIITSILGYDVTFYNDLISYEYFDIPFESYKLIPQKYFGRKDMVVEAIKWWLINRAKHPKDSDVIKRIVLNDLIKGSLTSEYRHFLIDLIAQNIRTEDEDLLLDYLQLLHKNKDDKVLSDWMIYVFGSQTHISDFYPDLLLHFLVNGDDEDLTKVLRWTTDRGQPESIKIIKERAKQLLKSSDEEIILDAAFLLMYHYNDKQVIEYLLSIFESSSDKAKVSIMHTIGDTYNFGKEMPDNMYNKLYPYLNSSNPSLQRAAIETFTTYRGKRVVEALIPFLVHEPKSLAERVEDSLKSNNKNGVHILSILQEHKSKSDKELKDAIERLIMKIKNQNSAR